MATLPHASSGARRGALEAEFGEGELLAYSEVLQGILDGYPTLSVRGDTAEQCWRIVQPVIDAWHDGRVPLEEYPAGTPGPASWKTLSLSAEDPRPRIPGRTNGGMPRTIGRA